MAKRPTPSLLGNTIQMTMMMMEAQAVITMRLMGMAGIWSVAPQENQRMMTEKVDAMVKSANNVSRVALNGGTADEITAAAIAPVRRATRANSKRLGKRGLKTN